GDVTLSDEALLDYQVYVINGVALDSQLEKKIEPPKAVGGTQRVVWEAEISPSTGGFAADVKDSKAVAGRLAFSPRLGHESALSFLASLPLEDVPWTQLCQSAAGRRGARGAGVVG